VSINQFHFDVSCDERKKEKRRVEKKLAIEHACEQPWFAVDVQFLNDVAVLSVDARTRLKVNTFDLFEGVVEIPNLRPCKGRQLSPNVCILEYSKGPWPGSVLWTTSRTGDIVEVSQIRRSTFCEHCERSRACVAVKCNYKRYGSSMNLRADYRVLGAETMLERA
jgi:hypothetical protein